MTGTKSAEKAGRQSQKKRVHNLMWERKIKGAIKSIKMLKQTNSSDTDILKKSQSELQKFLDKASKEHVIHKNKANRLKSKYAAYHKSTTSVRSKSKS